MKSFFKFIFVSLLFFFSNKNSAQNIGINTDGTPAETNIMLDVKGTNPLTTTATQTIFQVKSYDANGLKMRLILGTNATPANTYGALDVYDATNSAFRSLSLQPNGGNVGIGITNPAYKLSVIGGNLSWGNAAEVNFLQVDQGGSIELGGNNGVANPTVGGVPYIDFHYGTGSAQDYNTRIINDASGRLDFIGTTRINNAYNLPTADGSANQVMTTNGAGVASWSAVSSILNGAVTSAASLAQSTTTSTSLQTKTSLALTASATYILFFSAEVEGEGGCIGTCGTYQFDDGGGGTIFQTGDLTASYYPISCIVSYTAAAGGSTVNIKYSDGPWGGTNVYVKNARIVALRIQ